MIQSLVELLGVALFWTLLVATVGFGVLAGWCLLVELTEAAYRRRVRKGLEAPLPFGLPVLREGRRR